MKLIIDKEQITCTKCNETKPATEEYFYKQKYKDSNGEPFYKLSVPCKDCRRKTQREYKEANKDELNKKNYSYFLEHKERIYYLRNLWMVENKHQMKDYQKEYRQINKDKIKVYNVNHSNKKHKISKSEWESCKAYFNHTCAYCGITEQDAKKQQGQYFHKEHFINHGAGDLSNCVPACRSCNSQKWEFDFEEWYIKDNPVYNEERKNKIYKWINGDYKQFMKSE